MKVGWVLSSRGAGSNRARFFARHIIVALHDDPQGKAGTAAVNPPLHLEETDFCISVTMGTVVYQKDLHVPTDGRDLQSQADAAMYESTKAGKEG